MEILDEANRPKEQSLEENDDFTDTENKTESKKDEQVSEDRLTRIRKSCILK